MFLRYADGEVCVKNERSEYAVRFYAILRPLTHADTIIANISSTFKYKDTPVRSFDLNDAYFLKPFCSCGIGE